MNTLFEYLSDGTSKFEQRRREAEEEKRRLEKKPNFFLRRVLIVICCVVVISLVTAMDVYIYQKSQLLAELTWGFLTWSCFEISRRLLRRVSIAVSSYNSQARRLL